MYVSASAWLRETGSSNSQTACLTTRPYGANQTEPGPCIVNPYLRESVLSLMMVSEAMRICWAEQNLVCVVERHLRKRHSSCRDDFGG